MAPPKRILIVGAGYVGAALADLALADGHDVVLADNWYATAREQLAGLEERGARVETADIRSRGDVDRLLADAPARVYLLAAQASRVLAEEDPDYTEETNVTGTRRVAEAVAAAAASRLDEACQGSDPRHAREGREAAPRAVVFASSLNVYGRDVGGDVGPEHAYGRQGDLAHLSKVYGELCLDLFARRASFDLAILRLGIVYGPSPVEHARPESQTVVDKFRRLAAAGEPLPVDDGGRATIGVVHVDDAARILLESPAEGGVTVANVAAESVTVADVAALAAGQDATGSPSCTYVTPFGYRHLLADYLRR